MCNAKIAHVLQLPSNDMLSQLVLHVQVFIPMNAQA